MCIGLDMLSALLLVGDGTTSGLLARDASVFAEDDKTFANLPGCHPHERFWTCSCEAKLALFQTFAST